MEKKLQFCSISPSLFTQLHYAKLQTKNSYLILAPAQMTAEKDQKKSASKCFESIGLDPDSYRIGHTKART